MTAERPKRRAIPDRVKLEVALRALGLTVREVEWDHHPALGLRPVNDTGTDYDPPQLDPVYIQLLVVADHKLKTNGDHRPLSGDQSKIAKTTRLEEDHEAFRNRLLAKEPGKPRARSGKWQTRPFPKRPTK